MGLFFGLIGSGVAPVPPSIIFNIKYGRLYNWYAASDPLFAPAGWHVPSKVELDTLVSFLSNQEGAKLKESDLLYWDLIDNNTNFYNFNARGAGVREGAGTFASLKGIADIMSTSLFMMDLNLFNGYYLSAFSDGISETYNVKKFGSSVRLLKDDSTLIDSLIDLDGNVYRTCKIGNQVWLADNWACTKLNDDTPIPNVTDNATWAALITGACCAYDNNDANIFL